MMDTFINSFSTFKHSSFTNLHRPFVGRPQRASTVYQQVTFLSLSFILLCSIYYIILYFTLCPIWYISCCFFLKTQQLFILIYNCVPALPTESCRLLNGTFHLLIAPTIAIFALLVEFIYRLYLILCSAFCMVIPALWYIIITLALFSSRHASSH